MICDLCGVEIVKSEKNMTLCENCYLKVNGLEDYDKKMTENVQDLRICNSDMVSSFFVVSGKRLIAGAWFATISVIPMFLLFAIVKGGYKPTNLAEWSSYFTPAPFAGLWGGLLGSKIIDGKSERISKIRCSWIGIKITFYTVLSWSIVMGLINSSAHSSFIGYVLLRLFMSGIYFSWIVFPVGALGAVIFSLLRSHTEP